MVWFWSALGGLWGFMWFPGLLRVGWGWCSIVFPGFSAGSGGFSGYASGFGC